VRFRLVRVIAAGAVGGGRHAAPVASISEIVDGVRAALDAAATARAQLLAALADIKAAGERFDQIGAGSTQPDLPAAAAGAQHAVDTIHQTLATIDKATETARAWLANIAGPAPAQPTEQARPNTVDVERLRSELPPPITPAERGTGRKTHGRWVDANGVTRSVVSGRDEWSYYVDSVFRRWDDSFYTIAKHVEMKVAGRLRAEFERTGRPQHATIVQNQEPCRRDRGCAEMLPVMLPEGCSLTVHAPNYRRTFTGGKQL
jgi:hypothetical protein